MRYNCRIYISVIRKKKYEKRYENNATSILFLINGQIHLSVLDIRGHRDKQKPHDRNRGSDRKQL